MEVGGRKVSGRQTRHSLSYLLKLRLTETFHYLCQLLSLVDVFDLRHIFLIFVNVVVQLQKHFPKVPHFQKCTSDDIDVFLIWIKSVPCYLFWALEVLL